MQYKYTNNPLLIICFLKPDQIFCPISLYDLPTSISIGNITNLEINYIQLRTSSLAIIILLIISFNWNYSFLLRGKGPSQLHPQSS